MRGQVPTLRLGNALAGLHIGLVFAFLYVPILVLIVLAFNDSNMTSFPFRGFTLNWFSVLANDPPILRGLKNSFVVAAASTLISLLIGVATAYSLTQYKFGGRIFFAAVMFLPVVVPKTVLGLSVLAFTTFLGIPRTLLTVVFGQVLFCVPFVTIIVGSVLIKLDHRLLEAARDLGASEWRTFVKIVLPLILNGIVAGAFIAFILSFSEFNLSFFLSGREQTLPLVIFSEFRFEITPKINALSTAMVVVSIAVTILAEHLRTRGLGGARLRRQDSGGP